jgi:hypothetical protein
MKTWLWTYGDVANVDGGLLPGEVRIGEQEPVEPIGGLRERRHVGRANHVDAVALGQRGKRAHEAPHDRVGGGDEALAEAAERREAQVVGDERDRVGGGDRREGAERRARNAERLAADPAPLREQDARQRAA